MTDDIDLRRFRLIAGALIALGLALRLAALFGGRALWLDELFLAPNVLDRELIELAAPLANQQIAPLGFLVVAKIISLAPLPAELTLRLWSGLASVAALILVAPTVRRLGGSRIAALVALACVATLERVVWHGSEFKQYGGEFALTLLMAWLALGVLERPEGRRLGFALAGAAAALLGFAAPFFLAPAGIAVALGDLRRRDWRGLGITAATGALWLGVYGAATLAILSDATRSDMQGRFWAPHFVPLEISPYAVEWLVQHLHSLFAKSAGFDMAAWLAIAFAALGVVALAAERRGMALLLCLGPAAFAFAASVAQVFPFQGRVIHFTAAGLIPLVAIGLADAAARLRAPLATAVLATALLTAPGARLSIQQALDVSPPFELEGAETALSEALARRRPDDVLYVHAKIAAAAKRFFEREGVDPRPVYWGRDPETSPEHYLADVEEVAGLGRVWVVSGRYWFWNRTNRYLTRNVMGAHGALLDEVASVNAEALLYDFGGDEFSAPRPFLVRRPLDAYAPDHSGDTPPGGAWGLDPAPGPAPALSSDSRAQAATRGTDR